MAFEPGVVAGLPEPARRYFLRAIRPGTPLRTVAEIDMESELGLGDRTAPRHLPKRPGRRISGSSSLLGGYDEPEILRSSSPPAVSWALTPDRIRKSQADPRLSGRLSTTDRFCVPPAEPHQ